MSPDGLPSRFESKVDAEKYRSSVLRAVVGTGSKQLPDTCTKDARCRSGLCTVCTRIERRLLLKLFHREGLAAHKWFFATIFVSGWKKPVGDISEFDWSEKRRLSRRLLQRLRRAGALIVFGSVETVYLMVDNTAQGKPFHLHLMILGLTKRQIEMAIKASVPLDQDAPFPLQIKAVRKGPGDFRRTASYAFKQPFWKSSYHENRKARQFPKAAELRELMANWGEHRSRDRLILLGIRWYGERPMLTSTVKSRLASP